MKAWNWACLTVLCAIVACSPDQPRTMVGAARQKILYGADDRKETVSSPVSGAQTLGASSVALVPLDRIDLSDPTKVRFLAPSLASGLGVCEDEPFSSQPIAADCSGTLIEEDLVLTAGHCIAPQTCANTRIVFGYAMTSDGALGTVTSSDVFSCTTIVAQQQDDSVDYAFVRLDRPAVGRPKAPVRLGHLPLAPSEELVLVEYPSGLPQKIAGGARVSDPRAAARDYFTADLDAFPGASGGGVFAAGSGELVGVLARGPDVAYLPSPVETCLRAAQVAEDYPVQVQSTYVARAVDAWCQLNSDPLLCSCGDGVCQADQRESTASCPEDCGISCGDGACNLSETAASCYRDCGACGNGRCEPYEIAHQSCCEDCGCPGGYRCSPNECVPRLGNVNGDAKLDAADLSALESVIRNPNSPRRKQADVDCSGSVTSQDTRYLRQLVAGDRVSLPCETISSLALGLRHTCALVNGAVRCWGDNSLGQLGTSDRSPNASAANSVPVPLPHPAVAISAGSDSTCAIDQGGDVRCWGGNAGGQLGHARASGEAFPKVELGEPALEVRSGDQFSCALLASKRVRCWGDNLFGQLGVGAAKLDQHGGAPTVELPETVEHIALGASHACALLTSGTVRCWGANAFGQLGLGHRRDIGLNELPSSTPSVDIGGRASKIWAQWQQTCASLQTGEIRCWGDNSFGQLGYPASLPFEDPPIPSSLPPLALGSTVRDLALGQSRTCAIYEEGSVRCWGLSINGQLGYGNDPSIPVLPPPPPIPAAPTATDDTAPLDGPPASPSATPADAPPVVLSGKAVSLTSGLLHACVQLSSGGLNCWGSNEAGQLGYSHRRNVGDTGTPADAGLVPAYLDADLGWSFVNTDSFEVQRVDLLTSSQATEFGLLVSAPARKLLGLRALYAGSGAEQPGVAVQVRPHLGRASDYQLSRESARDLWTLSIRLAGCALLPSELSVPRPSCVLARLGYAGETAGWDPGNDYGSSDQLSFGVRNRTTRLQIVGENDEVAYGWSRPPDVP